MRRAGRKLSGRPCARLTSFRRKPQPTVLPFPVYQYGSVQMRDLRVDVHPHSFLGKVHGCSSYIRAETPSGFTTIAGLAPTFILDAK